MRMITPSVFPMKQRDNCWIYLDFNSNAGVFESGGSILDNAWPEPKLYDIIKGATCNIERDHFFQRFDGIDDYVTSRLQDPILWFDAYPATFEFWVRPRGAGRLFQYTLYSDYSVGNIIQINSDDSLTVQYGLEEDTFSVATIDTTSNTWSHIVVALDVVPDDSKTYSTLIINGVESDWITLDWNNPPAAKTNSWIRFMGDPLAAYPLDGDLAVFRLYRRAMHWTEAQQNYNNERWRYEG